MSLPKFFGQYLLENRIVSREQLMEALEYQHAKVKRLGEIGIKKGYLTREDVGQINLEQRDADMFFGELAVEGGYLTDKQLEELLTIQQHNHIYLGEALIKLGHLDENKLNSALDEFHDEQKPVEDLATLVPRERDDQDKLLAILDITTKIFLRVGHIQAKVGKLEIPKYDKLANNFATVFIDFVSLDISFAYFLNLNSDICFALARNLYKNANMEYDEELVLDAVKEFTNMICGNIKGRLLELGSKLEVGPPEVEVKKDINLTEREEVLEFPAMTPEGSFSVGLIINH